MSFLKYERLLRNLSQDSVLITATQHLAFFLEQEYTKFQLNEGRFVWAKPAIFSFSSWLKQMWLRTKFSQGILLLSATQEYVLWQKIIQGSLRSSQVEDSAKLASEALRIIKEWELPFPFSNKTMVENVKVFQDFAIRFQKVCQENYWLTLSDLPIIFQICLKRVV